MSCYLVQGSRSTTTNNDIVATRLLRSRSLGREGNGKEEKRREKKGMEEKIKKEKKKGMGKRIMKRKERKEATVNTCLKCGYENKS